MVNIIGKIETICNFFEIKGVIIVKLLIILILVSGIIYSFILGDAFRYPDEEDYFRLSSNLLSKHLFSLDGVNSTTARPPGYPFILAGLLFLGASIPVLRIANFLALALCAVFLNKLAKEKFSQAAGVLSVILIIGYPVLFYTAGTLYPQIIGSLFFILTIYLISMDRASMLHFFAAGFLFGYLIITVPIFLINLPLFALSPWVFKRKPRVLTAAIFCVAALSLVGVWTARNYLLFDRFVLVTSLSGKNLFLGFSEDAKPTSWAHIDLSKYERDKVHLNQIDSDKFFASLAWDWVKENKFKAVKLYIMKVTNYFNYRVDLYTVSEGSQARDMIMLFTYEPLLFFFIVRLILFKRFKIKALEKFMILCYISEAFLMAIFIIRIRYRLPFDFLMISVVANFLSILSGKKSFPACGNFNGPQFIGPS